MTNHAASQSDDQPRGAQAPPRMTKPRGAFRPISSRSQGWPRISFCDLCRMEVFAYICRYDRGVAPNIAEGLLTLACCKPAVRRCCKVGDLLVGFQQINGPRVVFVCRVDAKLSWPEYVEYCEQKLPAKIRQGGSGDCYFFSDGGVRPDPVHHKTEEQVRDWNSPVVLSTGFVYWGTSGQPGWAPTLVSEWRCSNTGWRGHRRLVQSRKFPETLMQLSSWLQQNR